MKEECNMPSAFRFLLYFSFLVSSAVTAQANATLFIIENESMNVSADDIEDIFTGEMQTIGTKSIKLVDNKEAQTHFLNQVLQISLIKYKSIWVKRSFRDGAKIPDSLKDDKETIEFVKNTPGAIGYVTTKDNHVKVIKEY
jgi:ABC-type phosphate transport system substrate-binding protein